MTTTNKDAATSRPWLLFKGDNGLLAIANPRARSSKNEIVFWTGFDASHYPKQAAANAALIVEAVNSYDALRSALENLLAAFEGLRPFPLVLDAMAEKLVQDARAALGKAAS